LVPGDDLQEPQEPPAAEIGRAARLLRAGELVAFPTETVYGLGADAGNDRALARLYAVKGRPAAHPVIVHLADAGQVIDWASSVPEAAKRLAEAFWPGPLTLILRRADGVSDRITGGQPTVGLRVPAHPTALALLAAVDRGLAAPSANRFGAVSPTSAQAAREGLADEVAMVLDGGPCRVGVESTIIDLSGERALLVRPGGLAVEDVERVLRAPLALAGPGVRAPGTLRSHYAPNAAIELGAREDVTRLASLSIAAGRRTAVICPAPMPPLPPGALVLGEPQDPAAYAHGLYAMLRAADAAGAEVVIAVAPPPDGLGRAVADRLRRAAAPRE
jgi:L-threonylcarbamoyladenylate synthase